MIRRATVFLQDRAAQCWFVKAATAVGCCSPQVDFPKYEFLFGIKVDVHGVWRERGREAGREPERDIYVYICMYKDLTYCMFFAYYTLYTYIYIYVIASP